MSGHSKWAQIKRQKGAADAKRGQLFTKLGREIAVAARAGSDPEANARLRLAIQRARDANMPLDTIKRAVERGAGAGEGANLQEITYEGYGPNGVAVLVEAMTDNRNRTAAEVRSVFNRNGGNLGESGSVRWVFEPRGLVTVEAEGNADEIELLAIDAGASDVQTEDGTVEIYTEPTELEQVRETLESAGVRVVASEVAMVPNNSVVVDGHSAEQMMRMIDRLEDLDDVQQVYTNAELPATASVSG